MPAKSPTSRKPSNKTKQDRADTAPAETLRTALSTALDDYHAEAADNPYQNPVERLALDISRRFETGAVSLDDLDGLVRLLNLRAFRFRATRLGAYLGETRLTHNTRQLQKLFEGLTRDGKGKSLSFQQFARQASRAALGIVITAHPTFGMSEGLTEDLVQLATDSDVKGKALNDSDRDAILARTAARRHGRRAPLDLATEQDFALRAIANIQDAVRRALDVLFGVAADAYPDTWTDLVPAPLTVASWVGYDLDGRADIRWTDTLRARLRVAVLQHQHFLGEVRTIIASMDGDDALDADISPNLKLIESRLVLALRIVEEDIAALPDDADDPEEVQAFARQMAENSDSRLINAHELTALLSRVISLNPPHSHQRRLAVLRAEMTIYGIGVAHTHVRLNATQIENAVRRHMPVDTTPDDPGSRRRDLRHLNELLDGVQPQTINFGSVMTERTSAKRLFMLVAQMLKFADSETPIRFLIAETDSAFVPLAALYFAKLFGIEDRIDISPLFETPRALEHGHDIVAELLGNPHYRAYVQQRGRIAIQTGFSDAGRMSGQIAASLAIERLRIKVGRALTQADIRAADGQSIELVIFDTHGESIGRGAHPVSFRDRLDYVATPASRAQFAHDKLPVKQELSFQGGDGYVYFTTPTIAFATVCRLLEHGLSAAPPGAHDDVFYRDTDYSLEFFITAKTFNERMMDDPDYAVLLNAFGTNLLYPTGSRRVRRQHDSIAGIDHAHPTQMRAIPHNSILQQSGLLANSIGGVGRAIARDLDRFVEVHQGSDRCRRIMSLVRHAERLSSLDVLGAYVALLNPVSWLRRAFTTDEPRRAQEMRRLARLLEETQRHECLNRVMRTFFADMIDLRAGFDAINAAKTLPSIVEACRADLALLHALRIALVQEIFLLAVRIPRFSSQPDATTHDVVTDLLQLDVDRALEVLRRAFPAAVEPVAGDAFGEPATYRTDVEQGYDKEHRELFVPLYRLYDLVRRVSTGLTHIMGAVG